MEWMERKEEIWTAGLKRLVGMVVLGLVITFLSLKGYPQQYPGHDAATTGASSGSSGYSRFWGNPASAALEKHWSAGYYLYDPFLLKELATRGVGITVPVGYGSLTGSYLSEGFSLYRKQSVSAGYSRGFGRSLRAGLALNYLSLALGNNYGSLSGAGAQMGVLIDVSDRLEAGACAFFPAGGKSSLRACFQAFTICSLHWEASRNLSVITEFAKEAESPILIRGALVYRDLNRWMLQGGMTFFPATFFAGSGYTVRNLSFLVNSVYQSPLGFSPSITILYGKI